MDRIQSLDTGCKQPLHGGPVVHSPCTDRDSCVWAVSQFRNSTAPPVNQRVFVTEGVLLVPGRSRDRGLPNTKSVLPSLETFDESAGGAPFPRWRLSVGLEQDPRHVIQRAVEVAPKKRLAFAFTNSVT
jgi:hypothetical protein